MANTRTLQRSFGGGEVTPEFFGRTDDARYQAGAAKLRNFIVLPHGPAANRPGFGFVRESKVSTKKSRLIPFTYSTTQTMVLEFGDQYIRFHTQGSTLLNDGSTPYEVVTPYLEADLFDLHFVQSADVMTLVHPGYAPRELKRLGATNWTLTAISFVSLLTTPATPTASATGTGTTVYKYKVTGVGVTGLEESSASPPVSVTNNLLTTNNYNTINWTSTGVTLYNVYKESNGLYGYIGQTDAMTFRDENISADLGKTPPTGVNPFAAASSYPGAVSYFEQRRCFAGSTSEPQNLRMTRSGTESNLSYSIPVRDDDAINIRVAAREANTIRHIVPLSNLVLLTGAAEWRVTSVNSDAITPTSISVKPQSYIGANNVQPLIVNNNILYAASRGGHMREMAYNYQAGGYITGDLSLRTPHLFDGLEIADLAYAKAPQPLVWAVSTNGKLLGLTYVPEQQIGAWHQHDTDGLFESCCVVAEGIEDALYVVVRRTINGVSKRYVERMAPRLFATPADAFFVDCGATYSGAATTTITGLDYLEGKTVSVLGDGAVFPQKVVTGGSITLEQACSKVQVGLPILADLETLPLAMQVNRSDGAMGQGRAKNINKVWLRVYRSSGIFVGPSENALTEAKQRSTEAYGSPPELKSEEIPIMLTPSWADSGQIFIRQYDPLPLTIVSLTIEVAIGG
jgi:hypothetical protein